MHPHPPFPYSYRPNSGKSFLDFPVHFMSGSVSPHLTVKLILYPFAYGSYSTPIHHKIYMLHIAPETPVMPTPWFPFQGQSIKAPSHPRPTTQTLSRSSLSIPPHLHAQHPVSHSASAAPASLRHHPQCQLHQRRPGCYYDNAYTIS